MALTLSLHATIRCDNAGLPVGDNANRRPFPAKFSFSYKSYQAKPAARRGLSLGLRQLPPARNAHHQPMLDHCLVLRKNGVLLWRQSWAPMKGNPVDDLIRTMLMEVAPCPLPD